MEPTGTYYEDLAYNLHKLSFTVYVVPSGRVHAFFKEEGIKTKTDAVDASGLALMGSSKPHLKEWNPPCSAYRELRQLTRLHVHFKEIRTMLTNQKEALSHQHEPSLIAISQINALIKSVDLRIERNQASIEELKTQNISAFGKTSTSSGCAASLMRKADVFISASTMICRSKV